MPVLSAEPFQLDSVSQSHAELEKEDLANGTPREQNPAITEFRNTAQTIEYASGRLKLPGWLYLPGNGPSPAVIWNHGSEKQPLAQAELACFYTQHGFIFFTADEQDFLRLIMPTLQLSARMLKSWLVTALSRTCFDILSWIGKEEGHE